MWNKLIRWWNNYQNKKYIDNQRKLLHNLMEIRAKEDARKYEEWIKQQEGKYEEVN